MNIFTEIGRIASFASAPARPPALENARRELVERSTGRSAPPEIAHHLALPGLPMAP
jgi:hypothetical protein